MVEWKPQFRKPLSAIHRYGLAVLSVSLAISGSLVGQRYNFRDVAFPLYLSAIAVATWYGGNGPAALALVLSCLSFDYFFTVPYHQLNISRSDLAYYAAFAFSALLVTWFSSRRRRDRRGASSGSRSTPDRSSGANSAGQPAQSDTRHDLRP